MRSREEKEVEAAIGQFYGALNDVFKGNDTSMKEIWSHSSDVSYLGPQGDIINGWDGVEKIWEKQTELDLSGEVHPKDIHIVIAGDMATVQCWEVGTNTVNGKEVQISLRATNIFRKEKNQWKMISHQTDKISGLENLI